VGAYFLPPLIKLFKIPNAMILFNRIPPDEMNTQNTSPQEQFPKPVFCPPCHPVNSLAHACGQVCPAFFLAKRPASIIISAQGN